MTLISIENISKSYGIKKLFENISFSVTDTDKIGLIGVNGTGKSTLLKIIAGLETADSGNLSYAKGIKIEYLPQNPDYDLESTVLQQVFKGNSPSMELIRNYEETLEAIEHNPSDAHLQQQLITLSNDMKTLDLWDYESQVKTILTKLGVTDFNKKMDHLSGGQKKRVALASALISPCDLLILDEPTNHMDNNTIDWLEKYLESRKGALIMITHDRYFLDRVVNKTLELDSSQLFSYDGNYSLFVEKKIERQARENANERKRLNLYRNELEWMRRGARARTTKQKARIQRFEDIESSEKILNDAKINISVGNSRLGNKIIEIKNISKAYSQLLIKDFSYILLRDDRLGIIGENGIGKSTLLNIITGKITVDQGTIDIGSTVNIGYFSQESEEMPLNIRAIEYIKETAEYITNGAGIRISASQLMETFLFTGDMQWTPISRLSGGERRRLYLLKILIDEPNILILDEPTNDLDIDTLKILEDYLDDFRGAVITVSHDRYFLDRTCKKIFAFEGEGSITEYPGNYSDYLLHRPEPVAITKSTSKPTQENVKAQAKKPKFTYKEKLEFEKIDSEIEVLEATLATIDEAMQKSATDFVKLQELAEKKDKTEEELLFKMERQEYLMQLDEEIKNF
ncbi:MAG: ABC transporter [Firmicutes bacterium HGW-Firmicutes-1]|jgi:ATP-binding cassette subfamily F protein uup|nr:MAG: ABC transporter [Firmicutes bacterium HGW-Firmicutes-1]